MDAANPQLITYLVGGVVLVVVMAFRLRGMRRERPLKLERLWIIPAIYSVFAVALFWRLPPQGLQWLWALVALAGGTAVGWLRGSTMRISVDPATHALNQRQSPAALILIVAIVATRFALRDQLGATTGHVTPGVIDAFVAFAVGLLSAQRLEMFLRARRLLGEARAV